MAKIDSPQTYMELLTQLRIAEDKLDRIAEALNDFEWNVAARYDGAAIKFIKAVSSILERDK